VELGHGQALRKAKQIVFNARRLDVAKSDEATEGPDQQDDSTLDKQTDVSGCSDDAYGQGSELVIHDANGIQAERSETDLAGEAIDPDLPEMNNRYAVVKIGGKTRVVTFEEDATYPGCKVPVFSTIPDFCAFHAKRKKLVIGKNGKEKKIGLGRWWIDHEQRRQFDGIVYAPGLGAANGKLNSLERIWMRIPRKQMGSLLRSPLQQHLLRQRGACGIYAELDGLRRAATRPAWGSCCRLARQGG